MGAHNRKLHKLTLDIGGTEFQMQCRVATIENNTDDPEQFHTFGGDEGSFAEAADPSYSLALELYADWRTNGISDYLWLHDGQTVSFELVHHPDTPAETVSWSGELLIKAPNVGGEVRTTELTTTTMAIIGTPVYSRP
jgi:hypothetical protein